MTLNDETAERIVLMDAVDEAFQQHDGAPTWQDDPAGRSTAIRWHMRGFEDGLRARDAEVEELRARIKRAEDFVSAHYLDTQMGQKVLAILDESPAERETPADEWEYMRPVSGFGWPQGYPEPCDKEHATHRRRKAGPWEPVPSHLNTTEEEAH